MSDDQLVIDTRGALVQYVLQRYQIDSAKMHAKATAQQIVVANLDELQPLPVAYLPHPQTSSPQGLQPQLLSILDQVTHRVMDMRTDVPITLK
jgi:hypothetical protein